MSKTSPIFEYNNNNEIIKQFEANNKDLSSSNNKNSNPPKKGLKKEESVTTKAGVEEKDIISNDPSILKKYQSSEISYDSYRGEKPILIDNLVENGVEFENNYINYPKEYEEKLKFKILKNAIFDSEENEEDENDHERPIFYSQFIEDDYKLESKFNYKGKLKHKNKRIIKLLDGEEVMKGIKDGYNSDNYDEFNYNKNKKNKKKEEFFDNEYSPNITDNILSNYKNPRNKNNFRKKDSKNDEKSINNNNLINDDTSKSHTRKENNLTMSVNLTNENKGIFNLKSRKGLPHPNINDNNDENDNEEYGQEKETKEKLKTEIDIDEKKLIKKTLKDSSNYGIQEESYSSTIKRINRTIISNKSEKEMLKKGLKHGKKDNKKNLKFEEEEEKNGDNAIPNNKYKGLKKGLKNQKRKKKKEKGKNDIIDVNDVNNDEKKEPIILEKKSDFEVFHDKVLGSSLSSFVETISDSKEKKVKSDVNFALFYWRYFKNRELILVTFIDTKESIPYFVRWSCFIFCLFFLFLLNCLFLFESTVHNKLDNVLKGEKNDIKYYFKHEFIYCIYVSLIYIVFKMIIIKLVLNRALKLKKEAKRMMRHSYEKELGEDELNELKNKRVKYLINYHIRLIIYFVVLLILCLFFAYISICYSEIFKNSIINILLGFAFSIIITFILCAFFCLIIVIIYKIGKRLRNKCLMSTYVVLSTMY